MLDGGSTRHVIARSLCEELGICGEKVKMSVTTLDRKVEGIRRVADIDVEGVNGVNLTLSGAIFGDMIASGGDALPCREDVAGMPHLDGICFPAFVDGGGGVDVGVIIGAEHAHVWMAGERRQGPRGLPMGVATTLGWGLIGPKKLSVLHFACHYISSQCFTDEIAQDVEKVFARGFESVDEEAEALSLEDKFALRQMEESIR